MVLIGDGNKKYVAVWVKLGNYKPLSSSTTIIPVDVGAAVSQAVSAVLVHIHSLTGL